MIDTHCHLTDERLGAQVEDVLARAKTAGVGQVITVATGIEDSAACVAVCRGKTGVRCTVGIHPNYSGQAEVSEVPLLRGLQANKAVVALGEMGLDYHYERAPVAHQRGIFEAQLQIALEVGKPVVIHCREAVEDCLAVLSGFKQVPAVFHCFTGTTEEARRILDAGYLLGFTGPITFKKNDELREVVRLTPVDRMLMETDAPYLTPEPMRKIKTNEPAFVVHTARVAAEVKGMSYEELDRITSETAHQFFGFT